MGGSIRKLLPPRTLLNDLTHGGFSQIADKIHPAYAKVNASVISNERWREVVAKFCIKHADRMLCLSSVVMHIDLGDPAKADLVSEIYKQTVSTYE